MATSDGAGVQLESISSGGGGGVLFSRADTAGADVGGGVESGAGDDATTTEIEGPDMGSDEGDSPSDPMLMMRIGRSTSPRSPSELGGDAAAGVAAAVVAVAGGFDVGRGGRAGFASTGAFTSGVAGALGAASLSAAVAASPFGCPLASV